MAGFFDKLRQGLSKTGSGIAAIFTGSGIDDEFYEELEEAHNGRRRHGDHR